MAPQETSEGRSNQGSEPLRIVNALLKQELDFRRRFQEHVDVVDKKLKNGKWQLGLFGATALALAYFSMYEKLSSRLEEDLGKRVTERLDAEFSQPTIKDTIQAAAAEATQKIIRERLAFLAETEKGVGECLINRLTQDLFELQCYSDGGTIDFSRGTCVFKDGIEKTSVPPYPQANCDQVQSEVSK